MDVMKYCIRCVLISIVYAVLQLARHELSFLLLNCNASAIGTPFLVHTTAWSCI